MLNRLQKILAEKGLDALIVSKSANITYLAGYSGFSEIEREAYLIATKKQITLFTNARYLEEVKNIINKNITLKPRIEFEKELKKLAGKKIGFEENLTYSEYKYLRGLTKIKLTQTEDIVENLRTTKSLIEIEKIRRACNLTDKAFKHVLKKIKPGITEKEIAFEIEFFIKTNGGELAFPSIVAFGKNSAIPHHHTSETKLNKKDSFVLLDFGAKYKEYCADMTRTLINNTTEKALKIYKTVLEAQEKALEYANTKNGMLKACEIDKTARNYIISLSYPSIPHSVGHGVGLEVHESPSISKNSTDEIFPNSIFTIEPGIYIPEFGGVRIEDVVLKTNIGLETLTKSPKNHVAKIKKIA